MTPDASELGQRALHTAGGGLWQYLLYYRPGMEVANLSSLLVTDLPPWTPRDARRWRPGLSHAALARVLQFSITEL